MRRACDRSAAARVGVSLAFLSLVVFAVSFTLPATAGASEDSASGPTSPAPTAPADFLGYEIGERFTPHHRMVDYLRHLAETSDRAVLETYGESVEGRPLTYLAITSPRNHRRLGEIFASSRALGTDDAAPPADQPMIVWLAYGVHGNESSSSEAALEVAWTLVRDEAALLDDVVVILDPLVNPDGRERYVHFFRSRVGASADPHPDSMEHREPWPGGRFNHYLFDLNRDWTWLTQVETRQRLETFRWIEPQIYVDVHEMQASSTYYFAPPADPLLPLFGDGAFDDLVLLGDANARAFDRRGWTYFVREVFDFFYPGYGDTYPTLRGGLGMTYEMAGGGRAGRLVRRDDGSFLTLAERVARHRVATLETVRTAARHRERLLRGFTERRRMAGQGAPRTYLWTAEQPESKGLAGLLLRHGVEVRRLAEDRELRLRSLLEGDEDGRSDAGKTVTRKLPAGSYLVDTRGPLGALVRALLDRHHELDADYVARQRRRLARGQGDQIFDVTAWSLPLAYGVETWLHDGWIDDSIDNAVPAAEPATPSDDADAATEASDEARVGWIVEPQGLRGYRLAAGLLRAGIRFRVAAAATTPETSTSRTDAAEEPDESTRGTLFVAREDQDLFRGDDLDAEIRWLARSTDARAEPVSSSWTEGQRSLGSNVFRRVSAPTVALVGGEGVSATSHGSLWHLFDRQVGFPLRRLDRGDLEMGRVSLDDVDVLILPDGRWADVADGARERLGEWLRGGGQLLLVEDAWELAQAAEWTAIEERQPSGDAGTASDGAASDAESPRYQSLDAERLPADRLTVPGAFVATEVQAGHPFALGLPGPPAMLLRGGRFFEPTGDPRIDLLRVADVDPVLSGRVWEELEPVVAGSLLVAVERVGEGRVVTFAQDPSYRGFTRATMPLLLGAALFSPSL